MKKVKEKIIQFLEDYLQIDDFGENVSKSERFEELGINSLVFIRLLVELENEYNIEFDDDIIDFERISSISELSNYILLLMENKLGGKKIG